MTKIKQTAEQKKEQRQITKRMRAQVAAQVEGTEVVEAKVETQVEEVAVLHVFAHGKTWTIARADHEVLFRGDSQADAYGFLRAGNVSGTYDIVPEKPAGWVLPIQESLIKPADDEVVGEVVETRVVEVVEPAAPVVNQVVRELGEEVASVEAKTHGMQLRKAGKPLQSKAKAVAVVMGLSVLSTGVGQPGAVLLVEENHYQPAELQFVEEKPAKAKGKAKAAKVEAAPTEGAVVAGRGQAGRQEAAGLSMTAILRYFGSEGLTNDQATKACESLGLAPNRATVVIQVRGGKTGTRGGRPQVNAEQVAVLNAAAAKGIDACKAG